MDNEPLNEKDEKLLDLFMTLIDFNEEEQSYINDLLTFSKHSEARKKEVIEWHKRRGMSDEQIESVKNLLCKDKD